MATMREIIRWAGLTGASAGRALARRPRAALARLAGGDELLVWSERKFEALLEAVPDAIVLIDGHGRIVLVNQRAERVFGWSRRELIGQSIDELIPERLRARHREHLAAYMREPRARPTGGGVELAARRRDGSELPVEISLGPLSTPDGPLVCGVIRDVSERRLVEAARREAEDLFRSAFEAAPVGMALAELDGSISKVNPALCRIVGRSAIELQGASLTAILHADDAAREAEALARLVRGEDAGHRAERRYLHREGHPVAVDVSVAVVGEREGGTRHLLVQVSDITERKRFETELLYLADHDPLTGMFNRRRFEQELARELARLARHGGQAALLAIDLDRFKTVNDTLGHAAGDELIAAVAGALRERLRETDTLARLGGDEFAVILAGCSGERAVAVAHSLLAAVRDQAPALCDPALTTHGEHARRFGGSGAPPHVTASIGIALLDAQGQSGEETLVQADVAMYEAKASGGDHVAVYEPYSERRGAVQPRPAWAQRIADALQTGGLMLYAQPIVALGRDPLARDPLARDPLARDPQGRDPLARCELLLRMRDADREPIAPESFLHVAERSELIGRIDRWVLEQAVALLARRRRAGRPIHVAVNISASSIVDPTLPRDLAALLARHRVSGEGLCIEVSEQAAIVNIAHAPGFARELSALGCELALDDFGAGFASFYYLEHLEFDYLKIDGEFIRRLPESHVNQSVVRAVVEIATSLGKRTIAESVEDAASLVLLRRLGVDFAQGFHVAVPRRLDAIESLADLEQLADAVAR